jgi:uncharacterized protein YjbI with pentapeptide repeats
MARSWLSVRYCFLAVVLFLLFFTPASADIYQWQWIDPAHPELGKQQSTTLCPGGAGIDPVPSVFLSSRDLTKAYLIGYDLSNASCSYPGANLTNADFTLANLSSANFYISTMINANFTQANLTNARLGYGKLTGAVFTNANIRGADFSVSMNIGPNGFTLAQLQSTASYKAADLSGIRLVNTDLSGWDFHYQNLTNATFMAATLTGTILDGADTRGAAGIYYPPASTINTIRSDGTIQGLNLSGGKTFLVRDYDGDPTRTLAPIPITVQNSMAMGSNGIIHMVLEQDAWDSRISFAPGISVALGGTLKLIFADGIDISSQVGRTFSLFDWSSVSPTGTFITDSPYAWDLSNLYTTGYVTLLAVPEPATMALLATGFLCLFIRNLHNRKRHLPGFYL